MAIIRPATLLDLDACYDVCLRTGDAGSDATGLLSDPRLLGEVYVGPYLRLSSGRGMVAEDADGVGAYVLAAVDTAAFEAEAEADWWPPLRERYPLPDPTDPSIDAELIRIIHAPPVRDAAIAAAYPAHLHIDLLPRLQGQGLGRRMMDAMLGLLGDEGISGAHLEVDPSNHRAIGFYEHLGFETLQATDEGVVMGLALGSPVTA